MAGERYIIATTDNQLQITVRNILNPVGFLYLVTCNDAVNLMRQIRGSSPDFIILDTCFNMKDIKQVVETLDQDMTCACVLLGDSKERKVLDLIDCSSSLFVCPKTPSRELLTYSVELAIVNFKRICKLTKKLNEISSNFDTRKILERAKGILMQRDKISEDDAHSYIRKRSMDSRMSIRAVAEEIITTHH
jgi:response regulator NasT